MSNSGRDGIEPEIIISTLKHTSIPTLLVEGTGDVSIYRWLETHLGVGKIDILKCGGRVSLFEVYGRRHEFSTKPVLFLADLDDFIYFGVKLDYKDIIFTAGYSIENDILEGKSIDYLFETSEKAEYDKVLLRLLEIYSQKIVIRSTNDSEGLDLHPSVFYDFDSSAFKASHPYDMYTHDPLWLDHIKCQPFRLVRGKNLVNLYTSILSKRTRKSKYSRENIIELHLKQGEMPPRIAETIAKLIEKFRDIGIAI